MAKSFQDFSSKRQFHWTAKVSNEEQEQQEVTLENPSPKHPSNRNEGGKTENVEVYPFKNPEVSNNKSSTLNTIHENKAEDNQLKQESSSATRRKLQTVAVARLKSVLTAFGRNRANFQQGLGTRVVGTLFGHRRGHVHFAFQKDSTSQPAFLVELATPISGLVREMASGLVRIALECDKEEEKKWTYCNGKKCGFATRREIGAERTADSKSWNGEEEGADSGEIMYMRAKFERVIGSRDSEAFYMMNPDSNGAPELSIYLLRV
ncbi:unnamed protein product [Withania somnifera]